MISEIDNEQLIKRVFYIKTLVLSKKSPKFIAKEIEDSEKLGLNPVDVAFRALCKD